MTSTPGTSPRLVYNDQSTMEDLEAKLKLLEERSLGSSTYGGVSLSSPYTVHCKEEN